MHQKFGWIITEQIPKKNTHRSYSVVMGKVRAKQRQRGDNERGLVADGDGVCVVERQYAEAVRDKGKAREEAEAHL